ncbi:hypothetical protein K491DRAFT_778034 [Lophiostoma macrostomum CBS 122681]|uniref:Uncharacterized protein n=1 Tax=Lophiostoma macrostomum CBS 122681 TaxID=1314788 RepID=A0A6A6TAL6_9PLEO|nr:hypothetical protein K491DRAFT_778034 [Lophiostoma macrostomum CBS 122681]
MGKYKTSRWEDKVSMYALAFAANQTTKKVSRASWDTSTQLKKRFKSRFSGAAVERHLRNLAKLMGITIHDIVHDRSHGTEMPEDKLTLRQRKALHEAYETIAKEAKTESQEILEIDNTTSEAAASVRSANNHNGGQVDRGHDSPHLKDSREKADTQVRQSEPIVQDLEEELQVEADRRRHAETNLQVELDKRLHAEAELQRLQERIQLQRTVPDAQTPGHSDVILDRAQRFDHLIRYARLPRQSPNEIPGTPIQHELLRAWASLQGFLSSSFPSPVRSPLEYSDRGVSSDLVGFAQRLFGSTIQIPIQDPEWLAQGGFQLMSTNVLKAYAAFHLIQIVFSPGFPAFECAKEPCKCPMGDCQCPRDSCKCSKGSCKVLHQYRKTQALISPDTVLLFDHMAYKTLTEEGNFEKELLPSKATEISEQLSSHSSKDSPEQGKMRFLDCAKRALRLKVELLLSKPGYHIAWIDANEEFDPGSMEAVEHAGPVNPGARVKHCVFPALLEYDVVFPPPDLPSALIRNKRFFSKRWAVNNDVRVVGKAAVMIG